MCHTRYNSTSYFFPVKSVHYSQLHERVYTRIVGKSNMQCVFYGM